MNASSTFTAADGDGYELVMGRWSQRLAIQFLDFTGTQDGERVLEVGCGTGHLAQAIVERSMPSEVRAIDLAPAYIDYAKRHNQDPRVVFQVGDACAIEFADHTFDRAFSLLVLHFVPQAAQAIAEMRRVVKPGGVVAAAVWDVRGGFVANRMFFVKGIAL
jgi:ubiquinone/menaquinone biosynthesis C-methylase UbiE